MEFHFRAPAGLPQTDSSSSSTIASLSEQELPAYPRSSPTQNPELTPREVVQRQIENEGTKTNKTELGAEVRRELIAMIEEEVAMRGMSLEERLAMRLNSKLSMLFTNESDTRLPVPGHQPQLPRLPTLEAPAVVKPAVKDNEDKLNVLAKPDSNLCGAKHMPAPPAGDSRELPFACLFKKPKDEWSCALCQVSATSEKGFKEHLQGKKHLIKEAGLSNRKMAKKHVVAAPSPEKIEMRKQFEFWCEICEIGANSASVMETHKKGKKHLIKEAGLRNQKMAKNHVVAAPSPGKIGMRKKPEFWCEICEIGADSASVMETHKKGKQHLIKEAGLRNAKDHVVVPPSPEKIGMSKKLEFWCEICEIGANSAVVMDSHKKGKKHLMKEAGLSNQKITKNHVVAAPSPEKIGMSRKLEFWCEICQIGADSALVMETHKKGKKHLMKEAGLQNQKMAKKLHLRQRKLGSAKKLEFWCEICEIGANSVVVMDSHKKGKKHLARLQDPVQNGKAIPSITTMEVSDDGEESKNLARVSGERDKKQQKLQSRRKQQKKPCNRGEDSGKCC